MANEEPRDDPGPSGPADLPGGAYDTLRRLERRLDEASAAAERLIAEAAASAARAVPGTESGPPHSDADRPLREDVGDRPPDAAHPGDRPPEPAHPGDRPPPAGWQFPGADRATDPPPAADNDLELLARVISSFRDLIPPELQRRLAEALREVLLALRALIDWYLERLERRRAEPIEVQDIPII